MLAGPLERGSSVPHLSQTKNMKESNIIGTFKLSKNKIAGFFSTYTMNNFQDTMKCTLFCTYRSQYVYSRSLSCFWYLLSNEFNELNNYFQITRKFMGLRAYDMEPVKWRVCRTSLFCTVKSGKRSVFFGWKLHGGAH